MRKMTNVVATQKRTVVTTQEKKERPWRSKSYPYRGVAGGRRSVKAYGF